jgi:hypothetical protein
MTNYLVVQVREIPVEDSTVAQESHFNTSSRFTESFPGAETGESITSIAVEIAQKKIAKRASPARI